MMRFRSYAVLCTFHWDELEMIGREAVAVYFKVGTISAIGWNDIYESTKDLYIAGAPADIITWYNSEASEQRQLFG
jgi:hypothetical protein